MSSLEWGCEVQLKSLRRCEELNGMRGTVASLDDGKVKGTLHCGREVFLSRDKLDVMKRKVMLTRNAITCSFQVDNRSGPVTVTMSCTHATRAALILRLNQLRVKTQVEGISREELIGAVEALKREFLKRKAVALGVWTRMEVKHRQSLAEDVYSRLASQVQLKLERHILIVTELLGMWVLPSCQKRPEETQ